MLNWPIGDGEMARLIRTRDWAATSLGPIEAWPPARRAIVDMLLGYGFPMVLLWGQELLQIYNDGYLQILGDRHPGGLGQPTFACWPETLDVAGPLVERARAGETVMLENAPFPKRRAEAVETAWFTVSFSPVLLGDAPGSVLVATFETTDRVLADAARDAALVALRTREEGQAFLLRLSDAMRAEVDADALGSLATRMLGEHMGADRCWISQISLEKGLSRLGPEYGRVGLAPISGEYATDDFPTSVQQAETVFSLVSGDVADDKALSARDKAGYEAMGVGAHVAAILRRGERNSVWGLSVGFSAPRAWTDAEVTLVEEAAERIGAATERARAEATLRESEERQAFLLKLTDVLRPIANPTEIQRTATRMLGQRLRASRVFYVMVDGDGDTADIFGDYTDGIPSRIGRYFLSDFSIYAVSEWRSGRTAASGDVDVDPRYSEAERKAYASVSTRAGFGIPLIKEGRLVAILGVNQSTPRPWTDRDIEIASEVAERTWATTERARAEAALRESEARFKQFASASAAALWIRDANTLAMEFVSPAIATIYGINPDALLDGVKIWASAILPEDRDIALEHLERARQGETIAHEFRILRASDQAFRWIRNTDFPLLNDQGQVQRIGGIAEDVTEAKLSAEHQGVLLLELQHRVRNIMAMIRSVANQTGDTVDDAEDYRDRLVGRLSAMARVQTLLTREANAGVDLATLIEAELSGQAGHAGQYAIVGPRLQLAPKAAEVLTLAVHELATNALEYGAFSHPDGRLAVKWSTSYEGDQPWLRLDWIESGALELLSPSRREGFGTALIQERVPYELKGRGSLDVAPNGLRCCLELPLRKGDSILETDTVMLSTAISGGSLDMTGEADLTGLTTLIVEDDYYLARDTARALFRAGCGVVGPVGNEADALALIETDRPRCALVDINLGEGARFVVADALRDGGIPFVFVTGYDDAVIPARFDGIERLRKPVEFRQVVRAAAQMGAA